MIICLFSQRLRTQLDMKRPIIEQSLEAGRHYLREEGEDKRLSTDSGESEHGKFYFQMFAFPLLSNSRPFLLFLCLAVAT